MDKKIVIRFFLLWVIMNFTLSCKTQKVNIYSIKNYNHLLSEEKNGYFMAKARLIYSTGEERKSQKINLDIRASGDSLIWTSIRTGLGIEISRILITHKEITIINRIGKNYDHIPFKELSKKIGFDMKFAFIKSIFYENVLFDNENIKKINETATHKIFITSTDTYTIERKYDKKKSILTEIAIKNKKEPRINLKINYFRAGEYLNNLIKTGPTEVKIRLSYLKNKKLHNINFHLNYIKTSISKKPITFPFKIPNKYPEVDFLRF